MSQADTTDGFQITFKLIHVLQTVSKLFKSHLKTVKLNLLGRLQDRTKYQATYHARLNFRVHVWSYH